MTDAARPEPVEGLPRLDVAAPGDALARATLERLGAGALGRWLVARRWFGAKGGAPRAVTVAHVVPLAWPDGHWAVAQLVTEGDAGSPSAGSGQAARWQLPLAVVSMKAELPAGAAPLARVAWPGGEGLLVDAVADPAFLRHLAGSFARPGGATFAGAGARWIAAPLAGGALSLAPDTHVRASSAEQSNSSILVGDAAILKLFRRLEPGEQPDVEVTRFLTADAGFPNTPRLLGTVRLETAEGTTVAGMLQALVPGAQDAWEWTLERGRREAGGGRGVSSRAHARDLLASDQQQVPPLSPSIAALTQGQGRDDTHPSTPHARHPTPYAALGATTRALHDALASDAARQLPDFAPVRATPADVTRWAERTAAQVRDALGLLARQLETGAVPAEHVADARATLGRRDAVLAEVDAIARDVADDAGCLVRHHGDYHLGQVLHGADGEWMVIDFEGEPSKPLAERRRKHSALRDVAGMLRSFAYAAATIAGDSGDDFDADAWERESREAFLAGYLGGDRNERASNVERRTANVDSFLPRDPAHVDALIALFELEKVFYELAYELNNRPAWVWIPLRGIARITT